MHIDVCIVGARLTNYRVALPVTFPVVYTVTKIGDFVALPNVVLVQTAFCILLPSWSSFKPNELLAMSHIINLLLHHLWLAVLVRRPATSL